MSSNPQRLTAGIGDAGLEYTEDELDHEVDLTLTVGDLLAIRSLVDARIRRKARQASDLDSEISTLAMERMTARLAAIDEALNRADEELDDD